jgi:16S rRNA (guanine1516-N2)-methyltransferase
LEPLVVTTSKDADAALEARARDTAQRLGVPFQPRAALRLEAVLKTGVAAVLIVEREGVSLRDFQGQARWSPGLARLRIKTLQRGEGDTLVRVAGLRPGQSVLDCTLGLGQDALVAAYAVGPTGRVVGLEKSLPLYALVSEGLRTYRRPEGACEVEPLAADAAHWLGMLPDDAFDCVLFDPMFGRPAASQPGFALLRRHAEHGGLTAPMLAEALRVARRVVVVKAARYSTDLRKLGLRPQPAPRGADVVWARVEVG